MRRPFKWTVALFAAGAIIAQAELAQAASFFVQDTITEDAVLPSEGRAATNLVKDSVSSRSGDVLVQDELRADYLLQPRLMRLGESFILTVEKIRNDEILFAAQTKIPRIEQLDRAARSVTSAAIDEPSLEKRQPLSVAQSAPAAPPVQLSVPYQVILRPPANPQRQSVSGTTRSVETGNQSTRVTVEQGEGRIEGRTPTLRDPDRKIGYWTIGVGPFVGRRLESDDLMYGFALGHTWDINPRASVKVTGEANFSSGGDGARYFNIGTGASYFFPGAEEYAPFVTADFGYGFAEDRTNDQAEGFSFGTGAGLQFFRDTETTMDLLLRYSVILDEIDRGEGNPSVVGVRLAVNF